MHFCEAKLQQYNLLGIQQVHGKEIHGNPLTSHV
jgi:hypothetical protein